MGDGTRELPWLTLASAALLVVPALVRPAARMWAIVFVAALALWLGLWTLPALWPGQRWLGDRWNWSGALLALSAHNPLMNMFAPPMIIAIPAKMIQPVPLVPRCVGSVMSNPLMSHV